MKKNDPQMSNSEEANTKNSFFAKIDSFIFKQVDIFLSSQSYSKMTDSFNELDTRTKKYLNHLLTIMAVSLPLFLVIYTYLGNRKLLSELEVKQSVIEKIFEYRQNKVKASGLATSLSSPISIESQQDFMSKIGPRLRNSNIDARKVRIENFSFNAISSTLGETYSKFSLRDMTMTDFTSFLTIMLNDFRVISQSLEINRDSSTELLSGEIEFIHLRRIESVSTDN